MLVKGGLVTVGDATGGGGKSFAQALQRSFPNAKYKISLRNPDLFSGDL